MTDPVVSLTGFARALRAAGVAADRTRLATSVSALAQLDPGQVDQVYWATRVSFCSGPDDLAVFDTVFDAWFRRRSWADLPRPAPAANSPRVAALRPLALDAGESAADDEDLRVAASGHEVLRSRDIATLTEAERDEVNRMITMLAPQVSTRRSVRRTRGGSERIDVAGTVRRMLRDGGEPGELRYRSRRRRPRRLVLLLDVSGSMAPYADVLLRFAHAAVQVRPRSTEAFTVGTRLTRVSRQLRVRDPALALREAGAAIPDWSGGTRLGEALRAFLDLWGQRGTARGAVVVLCSDGWERGDARLLGEQMARLGRLARRVVWVNPHKGKAGFAPLTAGMVAALPHVDALVSGHSLDALRDLVEVIGRA